MRKGGVDLYPEWPIPDKAWEEADVLLAEEKRRRERHRSEEQRLAPSQLAIQKATERARVTPPQAGPSQHPLAGPSRAPPVAAGLPRPHRPSQVTPSRPLGLALPRTPRPLRASAPRPQQPTTGFSLSRRPMESRESKRTSSSAFGDDEESQRSSKRSRHSYQTHSKSSSRASGSGQSSSGNSEADRSQVVEMLSRPGPLSEYGSDGEAVDQVDGDDVGTR